MSSRASPAVMKRGDETLLLQQPQLGANSPDVEPVVGVERGLRERHLMAGDEAERSARGRALPSAHRDVEVRGSKPALHVAVLVANGRASLDQDRVGVRRREALAYPVVEESPAAWVLQVRATPLALTAAGAWQASWR